MAWSRRDILKGAGLLAVAITTNFNAQSFAQDQRQPAPEMLPSMRIPYEFQVINVITGKEVPRGPKTEIQLPKKGGNIITSTREVPIGDQKIKTTSTFIKAGKEPGVFPIPSTAIIYIDGDKSKPTQSANWALRLRTDEKVQTERGMKPEEVDFLHVIPDILYRESIPGIILPVDADRLFQTEATNPRTQKLEPFFFHTPAFFAQYDWIGDYSRLPSDAIRRDYMLMHQNKRPAETDNDKKNLAAFIDHIRGMHYVPPEQIQMSFYQSLIILKDRITAQNNPAPEKSEPAPPGK